MPSATMGDDMPFIKSEPDASAHAPPSAGAAPPSAPTASAGVAKRDHLRALLDRARAKTQKRLNAPTPADESHRAAIKREPTTDAYQASTTNVPSAYAPVAERSSALLPAPGAALASTVHVSPPHAQEGLLPTPSTAPSRLAEPPVLRGAFVPAVNGIIPTESPHDPLFHLHHHHDSVHSHPPISSGPPASSGFYSAAPVPTHAAACACSHGVSALPGTHSNTFHVESGAPHWHYQAHPPPAVAIPSPTTYPEVDHAAIDRALTVHATTVSPTVSAATSSSSSSRPKRKSGPASTSSSGSSVVAFKNRTDDATKPAVQERRAVALKLPSPTVSSALDEYEDNELHSDFVHTVHMLIPAGSFGCLVGHRGEFMKEINAASECTLSVRDGSSFPTFESDRVLRIYGKPKGICLAQQIVIARIRNDRARKDDSSYVDLAGRPMAPMTKNSVTRVMSDAIEADDSENDVETAAMHGELRWLVHKDAVGKIMGQHGAIQKAIARDTNTTIHIVPIQKMAPGSTERTVIITGEPPDVISAHATIKNRAGGRLEVHGLKAGKSGQYFVIPQHVAGFLIGPNGTRIKKIRDETGARIQIAAQQDLPLGYVNRMLHIQGNSEQSEKAQASIIRRLQSYMGSPEATPAAEEDEVALQLVLPVRICSFLLDQRGRLIREISEKAGAYARFLPPIDDEHRVCVLYGDMSKVFRAQRLVLQFIAGDAIANKFATSGGAPPRKRKRILERVDDNNANEVGSEENVSELDSDDDAAVKLDVRGRARKRPHIEHSGRIVVHYSAPSRNSSSQSTARRTLTGRNRAPTKSSIRGKRRR